MEYMATVVIEKDKSLWQAIISNAKYKSWNNRNSIFSKHFSTNHTYIFNVGQKTVPGGRIEG